jgi:hypothetical protein
MTVGFLPDLPFNLPPHLRVHQKLKITLYFSPGHQVSLNGPLKSHRKLAGILQGTTFIWASYWKETFNFQLIY